MNDNASTLTPAEMAESMRVQKLGNDFCARVHKLAEEMELGDSDLAAIAFGAMLASMRASLCLAVSREEILDTCGKMEEAARKQFRSVLS